MDEEREQLVSRFRQAIKGELPDAWFDEDDLLDIFDFAGDNGDDYVRAEVLMWGARYFPDSDRLRERRGVFYADVLTDDAVQNFAADASNPDSLLTRILALRSERLSREDARDKIFEILTENTNIDDEETIQLVTLADETSNLNWLVDNIEFALSRVGYKPALLYEIAAFARDNDDYDTAIDVLKRLVDEMPYNAEYWNLLASAYEYRDDMAAADEAYDMALAIDPENAEAISAKALHYSNTRQFDKLYKLYTDNPDNEDVSRSFVQAMCYAKSPEAPDFLYKHVQKFGVKEDVINLCVMQFPEHVQQLAEQYFNEHCTDNNLNDVRLWTQWAESLASTGALQGSIAMMEVLMKHQSEITTFMAQSICVLIGLYYETKQWHKVLDTITRYSLPDAYQNLPTSYMIAVSLIKTGMIPTARETLETILKRLHNLYINDMPLWRPEQHIMRHQIKTEVERLLAILSNPDFMSVEIDSYNPL